MEYKAIIEAIKEPARIVLIAVISWLLAGGIQFVLSYFGIEGDMQLQLTALLTLVLKGLDKYIHKNISVRGITGF